MCLSTTASTTTSLLLLNHVLAKLCLNEYYLKKIDNSDFSCLEHDLLLSVMLLLSMTHV